MLARSVQWTETLRQKHASYDIIRELLEAQGVTVSTRTVARFCHQVIEAEGEPWKRQYVRKSNPAGIAPNEDEKSLEGGTSGITACWLDNGKRPSGRGHRDDEARELLTQKTSS